MKVINVSILGKVAIGLISVTLLESARADVTCENSVGKFVSIQGTIEVERSPIGERQSASLETDLCQNDMIHVGENSRAAISLINDVMLRLDQNTTMRLIDVATQPEKQSLLNLVIGAFKSFSRPPRTLMVSTPYINGLIEGTEYAMRVENDSTLVTVYEGKVMTSNDQGQLKLQKGQSALAKAGHAPQPYTMIHPRDAVQWTLYFPPVLAMLEAGGDQSIPEDLSPAVKQILLRGGNSSTALAQLEQIPANQQNAHFLIYRAALYLDIGRVDEARAEIDSALKMAPESGLAFALRAIIGVVRNEKSKALADAETAVTLSPSAAAKIALSYAQQANFQLESARDTLLSAVKEHPEDALAWARLGELWLMFGERDKALAAARKAEYLAPGLARTQTVLGFAALAENRAADARLAFERAISLASADPLAHFGLGLARIKRGDLAAGRKEMEAAVALDSSNALLRSYLGKAYYEEKRSPLDEQQYSIAKELDPADPTPYLYSAIDKQTTNRPVEALHDMQKAIELNDNRAIYRSRQLLDSDLAARSAGLARVYGDLGFQQLALREGWKSVNTDPSNFSAHRLLADSYAVMPRHEIARVSELLQSQLLQPLSMTPIQPRLAESNLFLLGSQGAAALSFNEFNPIFNRDGLTVQTSGLAGENNTYSGEGVVAGIYKQTAFSIGGFHYETDGFRENADQRDEIENVFIQHEFSPSTSIQAEYRYRNQKIGDVQQRFFPEDFFPTLRNKEERHTYRFSGRHEFTPSSIFLGSFNYQDSSTRFITDNFPFPDATFLNEVPQKAYSGEIAHLFRSQYVNLRSGAGYFTVNRKDNLTFELLGIQDKTVIDGDSQHFNIYSYADLNLIKNVTATVGLSYDDLSTDDAGDKSKINPKFGISWNPFTGTTLRAAAFKMLKRTLITDQTLEPTQIAGFNQFFDDVNLTEGWRYGGAVDQKITQNLWGGLEFSKRDLTVPGVDTSTFPPINRSLDWEEQLGRAYLFATPHPWLSLRAEYVFERFEREIVGPTKLDTHRVPFGFGLFHPSGVSTSFTATYWNQEGTFTPFLGDSNRSEQTSFWTFDAVLSYRLPKRYGFFSVGATNLTNEKFNYYEVDFDNPTIQPIRMVFGKITLALP